MSKPEGRSAWAIENAPRRDKGGVNRERGKASVPHKWRLLVTLRKGIITFVRVLLHVVRALSSCSSLGSYAN